MTKPVIGFIGLGLLGAGFVQRLVAEGYRVVGHDIDAAKTAAAIATARIEPATSPSAVAAVADLIDICVTTTKDVAAVIEGANGLIASGALAGKLVIDHSTTDIAETKRLGARLDAAGAAFIDAPVSGGPAAAIAGTLALMAGGHPAAIERARPVMERLGRFTHMGALGAGQATKLVNQTLVLTNYCVIAEAVRLAEAHGIDAARIPEALAPGHAGSNLLPVLVERMVARDFTPRGYARQVLKDLEMVNGAAKDLHLPLPMAGQALTLFRLLVAQGRAGDDGAAVVTLWPDHPA
jgi:3-hydroxyisobutyrate dehydrogenase